MTRSDQLIHRMTEDDDSLHVEYEQLAAFVDGSCSREEKRSIERHIARCESCAADLRDLRETHEAITPRLAAPWWTWAAAAAVLIFVFFFVTRPSPAPAINSRDAAAMRAALDHGTINIAPAALALREKPGTLMGGTPSAGTEVIAPIGTFIRVTRPRFKWKPLDGAASYRVEVYDDARHLVLASPAISEPRWAADRDLERGHTYQWQVLANDRVIAPAPPAPPARFGVLRADALARIEAAGEQGSHLLLAIVEAREGAIDDAREQLAIEQQLHPDSRAIARLAKALDAQ